jgi:DEAD/DEAH box helicase domain-containing protein
MIKTILSGKDNKTEIKKLAYVDVNHLFDSELERRFVGAFERLSTAERPIQVHKQLVNDKEGYSLQMGEALWSIEPQVNFGADSGIAVISKPDFVIRPKRTLGDQKPVAVFTDGYHFHNDSVDQDTKKRMAIMLSGKYRVWSLTYKDVQHMYQDQGDYRTPTLIPEKMPSGASIYRKAIKDAGAGKITPDKKNSFELLVDYLSYPDAEMLFEKHAFSYAMSLVDKASIGNQVLYNEWKSGWQAILTAISSEHDPDKFGSAIAGKWLPRQDLGNIEVYSEVAVEDMMSGGKSPAVKVGVIINDDPDTRTDKFDPDWNGFWQFVNVMQFNQIAYFLSKIGMKNAIYTVLGTITAEEEPVVPAETTTITVDEKWNDIMDEFFDDMARTCATEMKKNGIPVPTTIGFEFEGVAEAEMAWEDRKIVWLLPEQEDYVDLFKNAGWKVLYSGEEVNLGTFGGTANES